jgi:hypothetical protein
VSRRRPGLQRHVGSVDKGNQGGEAITAAHLTKDGPLGRAASIKLACDNELSRLGPVAQVDRAAVS